MDRWRAIHRPASISEHSQRSVGGSKTRTNGFARSLLKRHCSSCYTASRSSCKRQRRDRHSKQRRRLPCSARCFTDARDVYAQRWESPDGRSGYLPKTNETGRLTTRPNRRTENELIGLIHTPSEYWNQRSCQSAAPNAMPYPLWFRGVRRQFRSLVWPLRAAPGRVAPGWNGVRVMFQPRSGRVMLIPSFLPHLVVIDNRDLVNTVVFRGQLSSSDGSFRSRRALRNGPRTRTASDREQNPPKGSRIR